MRAVNESIEMSFFRGLDEHFFALQTIFGVLHVRCGKNGRSEDRKSVRGWLLKQLMRIVPGPVTEWLINPSPSGSPRRPTRFA